MSEELIALINKNSTKTQINNPYLNNKTNQKTPSKPPLKPMKTLH